MIEESSLGAYDFFALVGKHVINPGGLKGRDRMLNELQGKWRNQPEHTILEVGCGTGHASAHIAQKFGCLVKAIDISDVMVAKAIQTVDEQGLADKVSVEVASVTDMPYPDNSFDAVVCQSVLMFVDVAKALSEIKRVLKPGGHFSGLEFCWKKAPTCDLKQITYDVCSCDGLDFFDYKTWRRYVSDSGFESVKSSPYAFEMLSVSGFIKDEGFLNAFKTFFQAMKAKQRRQRMWEIWNHFHKNLDYFEYAVVSGSKPAA